MKDRIFTGLKIICAAVLAFFIVNIIWFFYDNPPRIDPNAANPNRVLSYYKNRFYSVFTEGGSNSKVDKKGYINASGKEKIDVLLMGSSHVEALQVDPKRNMAGYLNQLFEKDHSGWNAYSVGMSGLSILDSTATMKEVCERMKPQQYLAVEALELYYDSQEMDAVLNNTYVPVRSMGTYNKVTELARSFPYVRSIARELSKKIVRGGVSPEVINSPKGNYVEKLGLLLEKIKNTASQYDLKLIIFYHPRIEIKKDGTITCSGSEQEKENWKTLCEEKQIKWVDLTERFLSEYERNHILPYGFYNSRIGGGHLNSEGHRMVAEEIYKAIRGE